MTSHSHRESGSSRRASSATGLTARGCGELRRRCRDQRCRGRSARGRRGPVDDAGGGAVPLGGGPAAARAADDRARRRPRSATRPIPSMSRASGQEEAGPHADGRRDGDTGAAVGVHDDGGPLAPGDAPGQLLLAGAGGRGGPEGLASSGRPRSRRPESPAAQRRSRSRSRAPAMPTTCSWATPLRYAVRLLAGATPRKTSCPDASGRAVSRRSTSSRSSTQDGTSGPVSTTMSSAVMAGDWLVRAGSVRDR